MPTHDRLNDGSREDIHPISLSDNEIGSLAKDRAGAAEYAAVGSAARISISRVLMVLSGPLTRLEIGTRG